MGRTTTTHRSYSLPDLDAPANIPADFGTLADAVDVDMNTVIAGLAAAAGTRTYGTPDSSTSWIATGTLKRTVWADGHKDHVYDIRVDRDTSTVTIPDDDWLSMGYLIPSGFRTSGASYCVGYVLKSPTVGIVGFFSSSGEVKIRALNAPISLPATYQLRLRCVVAE